ncbi:MAG: hypothetical protein LIO80_11160 [Lachnospiraceae bacterium]|nr:hypothetical protein [Lachnospiraceae bacterium]
MKKKWKFLSWILTLALAFSMVSANLTAVFAETGIETVSNGTWSGSGTSSDPYLIEDAEDLELLSDTVTVLKSYSGTYFMLTDDITVTDWEPIGYSTSVSFKGTLDGNGKTITINGISSSKQTGTYHYYGLFGVLNGTVTDLTVTGTIEGDNNYTYAGGIAGEFAYSPSSAVRIVNCVSTVSITGSTTYGYYGGLVGYTYSSYANIINAYSDATVAGARQNGGIVGYANAGTFKQCVTTASSAFGVCYGTTTDCYTTSGLSSGSITQDTLDTWNSSVSSYTDVTDFWSLGSDGIPIATSLLGSSEGGDDSGYEETETTIAISDADGFVQLAEEVNAGDDKSGKTYYLTDDITLPSDYVPVGQYDSSTYTDNAFAGTFDGQGHTVTVNITDMTGSNARVGLFGSVAGTDADNPAVIKNVIVTGSVNAASGGTCIAGLVGYAEQYVEITNCGNAAAVTNNGTLNGAAGILGRAGYLANTSTVDTGITIEGCFNVGTITGVVYAAGIVYDVNGTMTIQDCYDVGTVSAVSEDSTTTVGGIVAIGGTVNMANCYAAGAYDADQAGAVAGYFTGSSTMSNVYYMGDSWWGSTITWTGTEPTSFTSFTDSVISGLNGNSAFQTSVSGDYLLLAWQEEAVTPGVMHEHEFTSEVTDPTCTEQGYVTHTCSDCGYSYVDTYTDATGHSYDDDTVFSSNGDDTHSYTCAVCGETVVEDCTYDDGVVTTEPTYESTGLITYTCSVCGGLKTETVDSLLFPDGTGTENDPYLLSDASDLETLASLVNGGTDCEGCYFELTADVTLSDWTPIGTIYNSFSGIFDGGLHTVTISFSDTSRDFNGLFGALNGATVTRVLVEGSITGGSFTAAVAGYAADSVIQFCGNEAAVSGADNHTYDQNEGPNDSYVGGIVGYAVGTRITSCYNHGSVTDNGTLTTTDPNGSQYAGGIAGKLYGEDNSALYCYNTGAITVSQASYTYAGGIAGMSQTASVMNSYNAGTITGYTYAGGVIGSCNAYYAQSSYSYYLEGTADSGIGGQTDNAEYITSASESDLKSAGSTVAEALGNNFEEPATSGVNDGFLVLNWENDGVTEISYPTEISTTAQLREFANAVRAGHDYEGETVTLLNDIDIGGTYDSSDLSYSNIWTAIGSVTGTVFAGTFDGDGYTISNMVILNSDSGYLGLFSGLAEGALVENLTLEGEIHSNGSMVGSVVGWNLGTVQNCVSNVSIEAGTNDFVGGIVADNAGAVIGCTNNGVIDASGSDYVGGVVGHMEPAYDSDYTALTVPSITDSVNTADVSGQVYVGGVVGAVFNEDEDITSYIEISGCSNTGDVSGATNLLYGEPYTGGLFGYAWLSEVEVTDCYTTGEVTGLSGYVGNLAGGSKAFIEDTYYPLAEMTVYSTGVGVLSGTNRARPVSEAYMATDEFLAMVSSADSGSESAEASTAASSANFMAVADDDSSSSDETTAAYIEDDVYTINIFMQDEKWYAVVYRWEQAYTQGLASLTVGNDTYNASSDDDSLAQTDEYGNVAQETFEISSEYSPGGVVSVKTTYANVYIYVDKELSFSGTMDDLVDPEATYTDIIKYTAIEEKHQNDKEGLGGETKYGVATAYISVYDMLSEVEVSVDDVVQIDFEPIDSETDAHTRSIVIDSDKEDETTSDGYTIVDNSITNWYLAIASYQSTTDYYVDKSDTGNALRLFKGTVSTSDNVNDSYNNVKYVTMINITTSSAN